MRRVIKEQTSNTAALLTLAALESKAGSIFGPTPTAEASIPVIDTVKLVAYQANPVLNKRVIGKEDVDIAAMIKKLGNSDWVREGRGFYEVNEGMCPFCQQETAEAFSRSLNEYFDAMFVTDSKAIEELATNYDTEAARVKQQIPATIATAPKFLDVEKLKAELDLLDVKIALNNQRLAGKKKEPSLVVELESLSNVCSAIKGLVEAANGS